MTKSFGRSLRLRQRAEYTIVQEQGRRVATRSMTVLARPNDLTCDRLGIIASRKLGNAVVRNRAKRRVREVFRLGNASRPSPTGAPTFDFVVIPRRELLSSEWPAVAADFDTAVRKLRRSP